MYSSFHERELNDGDIKIVSQLYPSSLSHTYDINTISKAIEGENSNSTHKQISNLNDENKSSQTQPTPNPFIPFQQKGGGVSTISPTQADIDRAEEMIKSKHIDPKMIKRIQSILGRGSRKSSQAKKKKPSSKATKSKSKSKSKSKPKKKTQKKSKSKSTKSKSKNKKTKKSKK